MKKIILALILIAGFHTAIAQADSLPIYKRFPAIPMFTIMTVPDSLRFTKDDLKRKKPAIIMLFSPDCGHCQLAVKDLIAHLDDFKNTQIVLVSSIDFKEIKKFYEEYKIADHPNIIMGRDGAYLLGTFYKLLHYPSLYLYNKKGKLVKEFEGTFKMEHVAKEL
ncbi:MAG: thioredoxin domain-containing protein [Ferruginibacter sp.]